ncbi:uncharacterized protein LOC131928978 [Physella acuta]|uniref:uncharacterized protein LOC131928978 n=1 Tax=Physella acuta TaxID=109671 RepID=UPI0027DE85B2|nr:uncharacterized protein LOC131928978 [Physella acuta]XP_059141155.1 uncharacterized protein LOC131928978 [Physella acuta]
MNKDKEVNNLNPNYEVKNHESNSCEISYDLQLDKYSMIKTNHKISPDRTNNLGELMNEQSKDSFSDPSTDLSSSSLHLLTDPSFKNTRPMPLKKHVNKGSILEKLFCDKLVDKEEKTELVDYSIYPNTHDVTTEGTELSQDVLFMEKLPLLHQSVNISYVASHEEVTSHTCQHLPCPVCQTSMGELSTDSAIDLESFPITEMSVKETMRRERMRQRKMAQRQSPAFRERERLKAKERMKALRNDPIFRFHERQRDRERRKISRLNNQTQRAKEREKDRIRKSVLRSMNSESQKEHVPIEEFQLLLSDDCDQVDHVSAITWESG